MHIYTKAFYDWLDDLCVRFIINLPHEELAEPERTCFQIEEAQWFYEDFIRPLDPDQLPSLTLKQFFMLICGRCPFLSDYPVSQHLEAFETFLKYKTRVPVRGVIMLNDAMDSVVLVKGWKKNANWSFPRGKINKEETDLDCAVREVYEETGYDLKAAGLVGDENSMKSVESNIREQDIKFYVIRGVPMDTYFEPRTRKEISKIQWYKIADLPTMKKTKHQIEGKGEDLAINAKKFYMVAPFLGQLKKWIGQQKKLGEPRNTSQSTALPQQIDISIPTDRDDRQTEDEMGTGGEIDGLLQQHRQQQQDHQYLPSDLPEVSQPTLRQERNAFAMPTFIDTSLAQAANSPDGPNLLALLNGNRSTVQAVPPQTPAAQMIQEPVMPHSPPHHHLSRMPTLPIAPTLALPREQPQESQSTHPHIPQMQPIPSPTQPARLVPQPRHLQYNGHQPAPVVQGQTIAPYERTDNSQFASASTQDGGQGPSAPHASNLPQPKLTQQKAGLLGLFKAQKFPEQEPVAVPVSTALAKDDDPTPKPSTMFTPPQVLQRSVPENAQATLPVSGQSAELLNMFLNSTPKVAQEQSKRSSLQPPSVPVELSALPSPTHSRGPSQNESTAQTIPKKPIQNGHFTIQKRPTTSRQRPPLAATISGPLNVPQFDMITKHNRDAKESSQSHTNKSGRRSPTPITILARPQSSHGPPAIAATVSTTPPSVATEAKTVSLKIEQGSQTSRPAQPQQLVTPIKTAPPPAPHLKAQPAPKPFHPQILRRPNHAQNDLSEPSPIQPLPSPKQSIPIQKKASQTTKLANTDHKRSLLSLFTAAPSPVISPSSATPAVEDSLASLVSPLSANRDSAPLASYTKNGTKDLTEQSQPAVPATAAGPADPFVTSAYESQPKGTKVAIEQPAKEDISTDNTTICNIKTTTPSHSARAATATTTMANGKAPELLRTESGKQTPSDLKEVLLKGLAKLV